VVGISCAWVGGNESYKEWRKVNKKVGYPLEPSIQTIKNQINKIKIKR
jgi:hypothetical protein